MDGIQFTLGFDPALTVSQADGDFKTGAAIPNGFLAVNDHTPGTFAIAIAQAIPGSDPGNVLTIRYHIPSSAPLGTVYPITFSNLIVGGVYTDFRWTPSANVSVVSTPEIPKYQDGYVSVPDVKGRENEAVHVVVKAGNLLKNVTGASFTLDTNTRSPATVPQLQFVNQVVPGGMLAGGTVTADDSTPGQVKVSIIGGAGGDGDGILADLPFIIPADVLKNTAYRLTLKDVRVTVDGDQYRVNMSNGLLVVQGRKRGDVANVNGQDKGNGRIDIADSIALLRIVLRDRSYPYTTSQLEASDVNCDGQAVISDVVSVLRSIAGMQTKICNP
jgi:hypothetical protein